VPIKSLRKRLTVGVRWVEYAALNKELSCQLFVLKYIFVKMYLS